MEEEEGEGGKEGGGGGHEVKEVRTKRNKEQGIRIREREEEEGRRNIRDRKDEERSRSGSSRMCCGVAVLAQRDTGRRRGEGRCFDSR